MIKIEFTEFEKCNFYYVVNNGSYQKFGKPLNELELLLSNSLGVFQYGALLMNDPSCTSEDMLYSEVGLFSKQDVNSTEIKEIKFKHMDSLNVCKTHYIGDIKEVSKVYQKMQEELTNRNYILSSCPIEQYNKHPMLAEKDGICDLYIMLPITATILK